MLMITTVDGGARDGQMVVVPVDDFEEMVKFVVAGPRPNGIYLNIPNSPNDLLWTTDIRLISCLIDRANLVAIDFDGADGRWVKTALWSGPDDVVWHHAGEAE